MTGLILWLLSHTLEQAQEGWLCLSHPSVPCPDLQEFHEKSGKMGRCGRGPSCTVTGLSLSPIAGGATSSSYPLCQLLASAQSYTGRRRPISQLTEPERNNTPPLPHLLFALLQGQREDKPGRVQHEPARKNSRVRGYL